MEEQTFNGGPGDRELPRYGGRLQAKSHVRVSTHDPSLPLYMNTRDCQKTSAVVARKPQVKGPKDMAGSGIDRCIPYKHRMRNKWCELWL